MKEKILEYLNAHKEDMIKDIIALSEIPSIDTGAHGLFPFGIEAYNALIKTEKLATKYGFTKVENVDNYVLKVEYGKGVAELGILAHLDVVPAGNGWSVCEPFEPICKDGVLYGRGVSDDKGPAIASLYALRCVKDLGIELNKSVQLILGCGEETGSRDIEYYLSKYKMPKAVFSPDGEYPLTNTEKGRVRVNLVDEYSSLADEKIVALKGGIAVNAVPSEAFATVKDVQLPTLEESASKVTKYTGVTFKFKKVDDTIEIVANGKNAHASTPQNGINAVIGLMMCLVELPIKSKVKQSLANMLKLMPFGDVNGSALGIKQSDEVSGELTISLDVIDLSANNLIAKLDCRYPICADGENILKQITTKANEVDLKCEFINGEGPHHTDKDTPLVKELLSIYEDYTNLKGECMYTGGGTYVHNIDGGVSFGCVFPNKDTHMHGPDECMEVDDLIISAAMFAQSIINLCAK